MVKVQMDEMYDLIGVGVGPFNLSLAALLDPVEDVKTAFFEKQAKFDWHPGMLIEGTRLQVPFLADLVTVADPTSKYSFLNYLKEHGRIYPFYFLQRLDMPRQEYNDYCQWVAQHLESCSFGQKVVGLEHSEDNDDYFNVDVMDIETEKITRYTTKNLVLGTGSVPNMPRSFRGLPKEDVFHTAEFTKRRDRCRDAESVTVVGSGQSAAEAFRELLRDRPELGYKLNWITRSSSFHSMEETKLTLEHFSPDYVNYFYQLPQDKKDEYFAQQGLLYKGISSHTITDIYNLLYEQTVAGKEIDTHLQVLTEVDAIEQKEDGSGYELKCRQWQQDKAFTHESEVVIVGTGYSPYVPDFVNTLEDYIQWDEKGRYKVGPDYRLRKTKKDATNEIYVHSGISHSHGVGSTNLGLAVHRNKVIINHLTGRDVYSVPEDNIYQNYGV